MNSFIPIAKFYRKVIKEIVFYSVLLIQGIILSMCSPEAGFFTIVKNDNNIEVRNKEHSLSNAEIINEAEYTLPQSMKIQEIDYEDSLKAIFIKYSDINELEGKEIRFLLFDINENKILWTAKSNMSFSLMRNNDLLLRDPIGDKLYDAPSGHFIRKLEPNLVLWNDGSTLLLSRDTFALIDIYGGQRIWERPGHEWVGYRQQYLFGDWCYVIAEGLHALELKKGIKWEYLTSTSFTNVGKELAKQVALSCLFAMAGGYNTSTYNPDITMNMNSDPLVADNAVYFAARDKIVCLDKLTGKLIWENKIDPELESMTLYNISDKEIALVGNGIKIINFRWGKSDPPTVRIIRKEDGKMTGLFRMDHETTVQSFFATNENILLLTPNQLLIFNKDLKLLGITESKQKYGNFANILTITDTIVLRTSRGLLGVSRNSFSEAWFQYCELAPIGISDDWFRPINEKIKINAQSLFKYGYYWTPNDSYQITGYNLDSGKEVMKLNLFGKNIKTYSDKYYIDFDYNKIKIISFK
jgi:hypothetical protein